MTRKQRQQAILEIIGGREVKSQRALGEMLGKRGFKVTQSTLSRDMAEMGLVKGAAGYTVPPNGREPGPVRELRSTLTSFVLSVEMVANLVVIKTTPGGANAAADLLDDVDWSELAGTVAGDDTILVIARSARQAKAIVRRILKLIS